MEFASKHKCFPFSFRILTTLRFETWRDIHIVYEAFKTFFDTEMISEKKLSNREEVQERIGDPKELFMPLMITVNPDVLDMFETIGKGDSAAHVLIGQMVQSEPVLEAMKTISEFVENKSEKSELELVN